jgi:hypothetical protein
LSAIPNQGAVIINGGAAIALLAYYDAHNAFGTGNGGGSSDDYTLCLGSLNALVKFLGACRPHLDIEKVKALVVKTTALLVLFCSGNSSTERL